jgi:DHA1 family tetracycline resistance protein-like MFS transporter
MSPRSARTPAIGFIFVTFVLGILGFGLLIPVLPRLVTEFQGGSVALGAHAYGALVGCFALMQFFFAPILGALSDRFGRRRVILLSLAGASLDYLVMGFAPNLTWLFAARMISGMTAGMLAAANAYVADVTPPERRAQNFGLLGAAFGLGLVIGPAVGGVLGAINIRLPFFAAAGLAAVNWLYGALVLPESLAPENRRPFSWKRANPVAALLALRKLKLVRPLIAAQFLGMLAKLMVQNGWVLYTGYRYGWSTREIGLSLALVGTTGVIVQGLLVKRLVPWIGEHRATVFGMLVTTAVQFTLGAAPYDWIVYVLIPIGAFGGLSEPAMQSIISRHVAADQQGSVQGALSGLNSLAGIFGPPIAAWSFGFFISPSRSFQLPGIAFFESATLVLIAAAVAYFCVRKLEPDTEQVPATPQPKASADRSPALAETDA